MANENREKPRVVIAGKSSLNMALELLRSASKNSGKRKRREDPNYNEKMSSHCRSNLIAKKDTLVGHVFSANHAMREMRHCLARRDWTSLRHLFLIILGCKNELEPIIWRYAFILLLASPYSDIDCIQQFLEMCIGVQDLENSYLLEKLLALPNRQHNLKH